MTNILLCVFAKCCEFWRRTPEGRRACEQQVATQQGERGMADVDRATIFAGRAVAKYDHPLAGRS